MNSAAEWFADAEQRERVEKKRMSNAPEMPEVRLIDANALLKRLQEQQKYGSTQDSRGRAKAILEVIHAPTIVAEPVKHGRWIEIERYEYYCTDFAPHSDYKCSECSYVTTKPTGLMPMFCEDCGAKMNGDAQTIVR